MYRYSISNSVPSSPRYITAINKSKRKMLNKNTENETNINFFQNSNVSTQKDIPFTPIRSVLTQNKYNHTPTSNDNDENFSPMSYTESPVSSLTPGYAQMSLSESKTPKTPRISGFTPKTPNTPNTIYPKTPNFTPKTPSRSPFPLSLALGSLSPRSTIKKIPKSNSPKLSKSPKRTGSGNLLSKIKMNLVKNNNSMSTLKRRQQTSSSNDIIIESIFNALFFIPKKKENGSSERGDFFHRIRAWDDESESDEDDEVYMRTLYKYIGIFLYVFISP